jgi:hypothetical protein
LALLVEPVGLRLRLDVERRHGEEISRVRASIPTTRFAAFHDEGRAAVTRITGFGMLALGSALLCTNVGLADDIVTDANIVTGLDISDSIGQHDMQLEIEGMARAIRSPEVLAAIKGG